VASRQLRLVLVRISFISTERRKASVLSRVHAASPMRSSAVAISPSRVEVFSVSAGTAVTAAAPVAEAAGCAACAGAATSAASAWVVSSASGISLP
jgi:hypothetical protein